MFPNVSAILLAAGQSRRMGKSKQLLPLPDRPVIVRCIETILAAGITELVIVARPQSEELVRAVQGYPVVIAYNTDHDSDMAGSVLAGLSSIGRDAGRVFVCLCDHPLVSPVTLRTMALFDSGRSETFVIPFYRGQRGHPTLFPRSMLEELHTLATLRDVIRRHCDKMYLLETQDEGTVMKMDTWEEYQAILHRLNHE